MTSTTAVTFAERLEALAEASPDRIVVTFTVPRGRGRFDERPVTIEAWCRSAARWAGLLVEREVRPLDRVLVALPTSEAFLFAFAGVMRAGAVPVPLPAAGGLAGGAVYLERITKVCRDADARVMITDASTRASLDGIRDVEILVVEDFDRGEAEAPFVTARGEDPAFIQYTSGSTGDPKGVIVTHDNLAANVKASAEAASFDHCDHFLSWLPLYHDMGLIGGLVVPSWQGAATTLMSPLDFMMSPSSWLHAITRAKATVIVAPNFAYSLVARKARDADLSGIDLGSVRVAFNGAEPLDPGTAEAFCRRFEPYGFDPTSYFPVYGLAEATLSVTFPPLGRGLRVDHTSRRALAEGRLLEPAPPTAPDTVGFVSVGRPLPGHEVRIVDPETQDDLPERRLGEITVAGPSVSPGYFNRPGRREPGAPLSTGDLGYLAEGELYVVDRKKDLIIISGRCYAPSDIEHLVDDVEGVRRGRAVAFSVFDPDAGTEALVVVAEGRPTLLRSRAALEEAVARRIQTSLGLRPREVRVVEPRTLRLTSSGKLARRRAKADYLEGALDGREARFRFAYVFSMFRT